MIDNIERKNFNDLLQASFKSEDTEEWIDVHFTRPIGLFFALIWKRLGVHPNVITILSIFLGIGAAYMFFFTDVWHNLIGIALLMLANFCDSTDGQLARLTGQKTLIGRVLDGFAGDVWFFCIYMALCLRLMPQQIPGTNISWGFWIFVLGAIAGLLCHSPQSSLADYYRQIHLYFLKGKTESELDSYEAQHAVYEQLPRKDAFWAHLFYYNYQNYCRSQERRTPNFQRLHAKLKEKYFSVERVPQSLKDDFLAGSRPLMPFTNILTFNTRAICLYITCLLNCPWVYFLFEATILSILYIYMHKKHETMCKNMIAKV
ncbi:MAG: CDP-alcohol phosphatidyltransferase family protein [Prevotella sp.]|nr:CDP-alcohol phosphatidyltransferase family protein [Prevotella sp.]